jgi:hypothetical protein
VTVRERVGLHRTGWRQVIDEISALTDPTAIELAVAIDIHLAHLQELLDTLLDEEVELEEAVGA